MTKQYIKFIIMFNIEYFSMYVMLALLDSGRALMCLNTPEWVITSWITSWTAQETAWNCCILMICMLLFYM